MSSRRYSMKAANTTETSPKVTISGPGRERTRIGGHDHLEAQDREERDVEQQSRKHRRDGGRALGVRVGKPGVQRCQADLGAVPQQQEHERQVEQRRVEGRGPLHEHAPGHRLQTLSEHRARREIDEDSPEKRQRNTDAAQNEILPGCLERLVRAIDADHVSGTNPERNPASETHFPAPTRRRGCPDGRSRACRNHWSASDARSAASQRRQLDPPTPPPGRAAPAGRPMRNLPAPTNLQVLPKNLTGDQVHEIMEGFAGSLGVHCDFCHAADPKNLMPNGHPRLNFADDSKDDKKIARVMIAMVQQINGEYISKTSALDPDAMGMKVTCGTCHRGHQMPEKFVPPPEHGPGAPPAGSAPPGHDRRRLARRQRRNRFPPLGFASV